MAIGIPILMTCRGLQRVRKRKIQPYTGKGLSECGQPHNVKGRSKVPKVETI